VKGLIFDPFAGTSGDMMLGALVDLGLPADWLLDFVASLELGEIAVHVERARRSGIDCGRVRFELPHEHAHRHLRHVVEIVEQSGAPERARQRAVDAFRRIAIAEAAVHGTTVDKVHFHEVGALDAILDVLCAMAAVDVLGFKQFFTLPVALGSGTVQIEHGRFPVPAPATLRILEGIAVTGLDLDGECTTPTGAAVLAALNEGRTPPSAFRPLRSGFGAGTRDPQGRPNCLRLVAIEAIGDEAAIALVLVQTDIDDMSPEYVPPAIDALLNAGAVDAVALPLTMKKGRPGIRVEALAPAHAIDQVLAELFRATSTIGARHWPVSRPALARAADHVEYRGHRIRRKIVTLPDGSTRVKPEFDDVAAAAAALDVPAWQLRRELEDPTSTQG
jgi:pyridinium-3,5-bisthiocarboxylic acid mononucleotide nickel chelatase